MTDTVPDARLLPYCSIPVLSKTKKTIQLPLALPPLLRFCYTCSFTRIITNFHYF